MARWTEDEWWDDRDEPPAHATRARGGDDDEDDDEPTEPDVPVAIQTGAEGSVYRIPTALWWFTAPNRHDRPGVCVRCDLAAGVAIMSVGRDPDSFFSQTSPVVLVAPTPDNGLRKRTAFALTPWPISIRMLQLCHNDGHWLGRLDGGSYAQIRNGIDALGHWRDVVARQFGDDEAGQ